MERSLRELLAAEEDRQEDQALQNVESTIPRQTGFRILHSRPYQTREEEDPRLFLRC